MLGLISITGVKHLSALLAKKFQRRPQIFLHGFGRALVIYNCALYNWKLSHYVRDIRLASIQWPWNPGYGHSRSSKIIRFNPAPMTSC